MSWTEPPDSGVLNEPDQPLRPPASGVLPGFGVSPQPSQTQIQPRPVIPASLTQQPVPQRFIPNYVAPDGRLGQPNWAINQTNAGQDLTKTIHMPNYDEMFGVMHGAGKQLADWGPKQLSPQYNALALMARTLGNAFDYFSKGAFWRNFNSSQARVYEAQRQRYELQREQMYDQGMQTVFAHKQMMDKYNKVFDILRAMGGSDINPDDPELRKAEEVLLQLNNETGHEWLNDLVKAGKLNEVKNVLDTENARLLDMWSSVLTLGNSRSGSGGTTKGDSEFDKSLVADTSASLPGGTQKGPELTPSSATTEAQFDEYLKR